MTIERFKILEWTQILVHSVKVVDLELIIKSSTYHFSSLSIDSQGLYSFLMSFNFNLVTDWQLLLFHITITIFLLCFRLSHEQSHTRPDFFFLFLRDILCLQYNFLSFVQCVERTFLLFPFCLKLSAQDLVLFLLRGQLDRTVS